ncbi:hypothetical protein MKW98_015182 [Papaver atlanticum]|uniref:Uncharacterized protein n=1 Tax=Papaver atlanticum TaxID=357466 RepID=A0AAD4TAE2_9MAGN|nr:hypothetical protein MKW98_015182 [Papaver atlanticum]
MEEIRERKQNESEEFDVSDGKPQEEEILRKIPPWRSQLTVRGLVASFLIGIIYSIIVQKISLTTGLTPTLNVSAALLSYIFIKGWTKLLGKFGFNYAPFTKQENTVIQTCAVACYSVSIAGGFGSFLLGLNKKTYDLAGPATPGNTPGSYKEPGIGWMTGFLFVTGFVGLFSLIPLRKIMIIDYKLAYPSGIATAVLINGFHTPKADKMAKEQVRGFAKFFSFSFLWGFFQWFYTGGDQCGFAQFPTFGLQAWKQSFFFDFSMTYIGAGMICSHLVNLSTLFGSVLSWGVMWPLIRGQKGEWYPATIKEGSMKSLTGYKVFISIALILGDGLYNFLKVMYLSSRSIKGTIKVSNEVADGSTQSLEDRQRNELFVRESIPIWVACVGYVLFSIVSIIAIPFMFPQLKWYYVVVAYVLAPFLGFSNAYGAGLTDMNMAYNYGKVALFALAAIGGKDSGVIAGLIGCGLVKQIVYISSDLMHDFKAGHLTLTSPRSMVVSQAVGTAMGCVIAPLAFFLFYKAFDIGNPDGEYKAPYALIYRNMAILGVEGFSALPNHCLQLCYGFFAFAFLANLVRDLSPTKIGKWVPLPMAMAVPFLVGASFAIDMSIGSLIVFLWHKIDSKKAPLMIYAVASGLMCGEGLWVLPASILGLAKVKPPICMKFVSSE